MIEFKILGPYDTAGRMAVHDTEVKTHAAQMAIRFAELILSASDYARELSAIHGEEEREAKLQTAQQISKRACDLASYLMIELRKREWIVEGPRVDEVYKTDPKE